jgi:hypothetical protein
MQETIMFHFRRFKLIMQFKKHMGYFGNFENPVTSQEKIQFRKLYGNHEFYARVADKYNVRQYVTEKVGGNFLIPLLGVYDRLYAKIFDTLPESFVIKANHGCKWNKLVYDKGRMDVNKMVDYFNGLLKRSYSRCSGEKHYGLIEPKIIIEELLQDNGELPWDYNLYCYNGPKGFDFAIAISSPDQKYLGHFDKYWNVWESNLSQEQVKKYVNPENFSEMVEVAKALSGDFDFVRVDLYNIAGKVYFGELTCTPARGLKPIENEFRNRMRAEMWELDANNTLLYRKPQKSSLR